MIKIFCNASRNKIRWSQSSESKDVTFCRLKFQESFREVCSLRSLLLKGSPGAPSLLLNNSWPFFRTHFTFSYVIAFIFSFFFIVVQLQLFPFPPITLLHPTHSHRPHSILPPPCWLCPWVLYNMFLDNPSPSFPYCPSPPEHIFRKVFPDLFQAGHAHCKELT